MPAVFALLIFGGLIGRGISQGREITNGYRVAAREAIARKDLEKAKFYYSRLVSTGNRGSEQDQFNMVSVLDASGDGQAASELLDQLAPDDEVGYAQAHKQKAAMIYQFIAKNGPSKAALERLHWHLRHGARDPSVESDLLWANYYLAIEQIDNAIGRLSSAANRNPDLWFEIAGLYRKIDRPDDAKRATNRAEAVAVQKLDGNPLDVMQRLRLADIMMAKGNQDDAQEILSEGLRLTGNDPAIRRAASNFALVKLKSIANDSGDAAQRQRFVLLNKAIELDPENQAVYETLSTFYVSVESETARDVYRKQLEKWITQGVSVAYAHFTLGNLLWLEKDQENAIFHMEKAFEMEPSLTKVANNLAWLLVHSETPDLQRAEDLVRLAIEKDAGHIRYADTLAAVLFAQRRYADALVQYEKVLPQTQGQKRRETHERLAEIYDKLGQNEIAKSHRDRIAEMSDAKS
tara:strand:- start:72410 stop:73798 length:1389 start_codon:yes stop_codon:yes gene_type:complete